MSRKHLPYDLESLAERRRGYDQLLVHKEAA